MKIYFNITDGPINIPNQDNQGTRTLAPGESFYGSIFYDKFVKVGLLACASPEMVTQYGYIASEDLVPDGYIGAHRYMKNPNGETSLGRIKYKCSFAIDADSSDPVMVIYYFYTNPDTPSNPSHVIQRIERIGIHWQFPTWEDLPEDFCDLTIDLQKQYLLRGS